MRALWALTAPLTCFLCFTLQLPAFSWLLLLPLIGLLDALLPNASQSSQGSPISAKIGLLVCALAHIVLLLWGMNTLHTTPFSLQWFSLLCSLGVLAVSASAGPVGHELIHKRSAIEKWSGYLIFSSIGFPTFPIEHLRGHHVQAGTPEDADSAEKGENVYRFIKRAVWPQYLAAFELEKKRLAQKGVAFISWQNELLWQLSITGLFSLFFLQQLGVSGFLIYLLYIALAVCGLQVVLYVSHYGLRRQQLDSGKFEKTQRWHSWNSNGLVTDILSVSIQKHSAHHAMPSSYFYELDVDAQSPTLPTSYYLMYALALLPPLWFKVMDPRVDTAIPVKPNAHQTP